MIEWGDQGMPADSSRRRAEAILCVALCIATLIASACTWTIGRSVEQRDIAMRSFGSGRVEVVLVGGLHTGSEDNSRTMVEAIGDYVAAHPDVVPRSVTLHVIPSMNPDGTANGTHTNARGVDLNRNWPADDWVRDACHPETGCRSGLGGGAPLSEPETAALYRFIEVTRPAVTIVWHSSGALVEANEATTADGYGRAFAAASGYRYIDEWSAFRITGQLIDALEQRLGLAAVDIELSRCCTIDQGELDRNIAGLAAVLQAAGGTSPQPRPTKPVATPTVDLDIRGLG
jgi:predicted deacylase